MFASVWGASPTGVWRAALCGAARTPVATLKLVYPGALTADLANRHLYWADSYLETIERAHYDGRHRLTIKRNYVVSYTPDSYRLTGAPGARLDRALVTMPVNVLVDPTRFA